MKRGSPEELKFQTRYGLMNAQHSIQDVHDLFEELITNADDSYHRLHQAGRLPEDGGQILLQVERHRSGRSSVITVNDRAEGLRSMREKIQRVGARTSERGDRGFMARGLKDCAVLGHVTVESIHDGVLEKAEITPGLQFIPYQPSRRFGDQATDADRSRLGIRSGNGTIVRVELQPHVPVPQHGTLAKELPWHYALRDILRAGGPSKVLLRVGQARPQLLSFVDPEAELIHDEEYVVPGYPGIRARFTLRKVEAPLDDPPDKRFRRSGILIKGRRGIYGCSFLAAELDHDPAAEHYFGRLECAGIDQLAEEWDERNERGEPHPDGNPNLIFDPNRRGGLMPNHPFTKALVQLPIEALKAQFERDREDKRRRYQQVEAKETTDRLRKLAREASRFMREKLEDLDTVAPTDAVSDKSFIARGVAVVPTFTQLPVGQEKTFRVKVDAKLGLPLGTAVEVSLSKAAARALELVGTPSDLEADPMHEGIQRGSFTLRGLTESARVQVKCEVDSLEPVYAEVQVLPAGPVDIEIPGGFAFHRENYTVRQGATRTLLLRARIIPPPPAAPAVKFQLSDPTVAILRSRTPLELVPGTTYYEAALTVEGKKLHGKTQVIAETFGVGAACSLSVVGREEEGVDLRFELVPYSLGQNYRAVWDRKEPNKLLITTQHDSVSRYLGSQAAGYPGQHGEAFRVLLAEIISDNVCRRIVEEHAQALPHEFDPDKIYLLHNRLMKEFTPIAHRIQVPEPRRLEEPGPNAG